MSDDLSEGFAKPQTSLGSPILSKSTSYSFKVKYHKTPVNQTSGYAEFSCVWDDAGWGATGPCDSGAAGLQARPPPWPPGLDAGAAVSHPASPPVPGQPLWSGRPGSDNGPKAGVSVKNPPAPRQPLCKPLPEDRGADSARSVLVSSRKSHSFPGRQEVYLWTPHLSVLLTSGVHASRPEAEGPGSRGSPRLGLPQGGPGLRSSFVRPPP